MNHLTETQLEAIIQDQQNSPLHLRECETCRNRLAEKQALAGRLRSAFGSVQASDDLVRQINRRSRLRVHASDSPGRRMQTVSGVHWRRWMALAAALVTVPLLTMLFTPSQAVAAQAELARIHSLNIDPDHTFFGASDPVKLAGYFKRNLGFNPLMPPTHQGLALRGCCVQHFRGHEVGSYVVDTPNGVMSVIVVPDTLDELEMDDRFERDGYSFARSAFAANSMVAARIGHFTYCAVGEVSHEYLTEVLVQLLAGTQE